MSVPYVWFWYCCSVRGCIRVLRGNELYFVSFFGGSAERSSEVKMCIIIFFLVMFLYFESALLDFGLSFWNCIEFARI